MYNRFIRSAASGKERLPEMTTETVLNNARIVLADEVLTGSILIRDGKIADVSAGGGIGEDMAGDFVIPGLVELHTDHLEGHYAPRPESALEPDRRRAGA